MARKVHIALVGGQPMPVYLGIKYADPDVVVFVYSKESRTKIEPIKRLLHDVEHTELLFAPSDLAKIEQDTNKCFEQYLNDYVSINLSGGTKTWTYYFTTIFSRHENTKMFYVDQNSVAHDFDTLAEQQLSINISEQLSLMESRIGSHREIEDYKDDDFTVIEQIKDIRKDNGLLRVFNQLTEMMSNHPNQTRVNASDGSTLTWDKTSKRFVMTTNRYGDFEFSSPNAYRLVLNAGWFEVLVSQMLHAWDRCREIWLNCVFQSKSGSVTTNEIDIIVNIGTKLLFVECKTQICRPTDIDKFNSVVEKWGGNGSKAVFVTFEAMDEVNRKTCERYGIIPFSFKSKKSCALKHAKSLYTVLEGAIDKNNL